MNRWLCRFCKKGGRSSCESQSGISSVCIIFRRLSIDREDYTCENQARFRTGRSHGWIDEISHIVTHLRTQTVFLRPTISWFESGFWPSRSCSILALPEELISWKIHHVILSFNPPLRNYQSIVKLSHTLSLCKTLKPNLHLWGYFTRIHQDKKVFVRVAPFIFPFKLPHYDSHDDSSIVIWE